MAIVYAEQVKELHATAKNLDNNMKLIHDWVPVLNDNKNGEANGNIENDRVVNDMATTIADQQNEIDRLQGEARDLNQAIADMVVQARTTNRHASVASQTTNPDNDSRKRSGKVPDPPVWNNETDRDT